jgi:hypothetical protein
LVFFCSRSSIFYLLTSNEGGLPRCREWMCTVCQKIDKIIDGKIIRNHTQAAVRPLGRLPQGSPKGRIETLGKAEKDCRMAAPKDKQVGKTCESNERERASQMTRIYTTKHRGRCAVDCQKAARRAR